MGWAGPHTSLVSVTNIVSYCFFAFRKAAAAVQLPAVGQLTSMTPPFAPASTAPAGKTSVVAGCQDPFTSFTT
jgi:hypothetical protein